MKIGYNSPVVLTYAFAAAIIVLVTETTGSSGLYVWFTSPSGSLNQPGEFLRLFSHVLGHSGWSQLTGNLTLMLLVGPLLEEKYGSFKIFEMFMITALVTGLINFFVFSASVAGGTGLVFMLILLSSFANFKTGKIPLTLILVALLFLGDEVLQSFNNNSASGFSHLAGGVLGAIYGFMRIK
jgi:membrane associated rhomboid family serine protease